MSISPLSGRLLQELLLVLAEGWRVLICPYRGGCCKLFRASPSRKPISPLSGGCCKPCCGASCLLAGVILSPIGAAVASTGAFERVRDRLP